MQVKWGAKVYEMRCYRILVIPNVKRKHPERKPITRLIMIAIRFKFSLPDRRVQKLTKYAITVLPFWKASLTRKFRLNVAPR